MKINFTKKEFVTLLEMIDIANWVISANKVEKEPTEKPYEELERKLFALSPEFGCEDKVKYSKELDGYYPTHSFEMEQVARISLRHPGSKIPFIALMDWNQTLLSKVENHYVCQC